MPVAATPKSLAQFQRRLIGTWLNLLTGNKPLEGPYPSVEVPGHDEQPADITIAKQIAVPHGNSILALGSFETIGPVRDPASLIPNAPTPVLPCGVKTTPYTTTLDDPANYQDPEHDLTANPRIPLQTAVKLLEPNHAIHWMVTTRFRPAEVERSSTSRSRTAPPWSRTTAPSTGCFRPTRARPPPISPTRRTSPCRC